jgi:hypothetical protein
MTEDCTLVEIAARRSSAVQVPVFIGGNASQRLAAVEFTGEAVQNCVFAISINLVQSPSVRGAAAPRGSVQIVVAVDQRTIAGIISVGRGPREAVPLGVFFPGDS